MRKTDANPAALAGALFDELIDPLATARRTAGAEPYFALAREPGVASYFRPAEARSMTPADFEFPGAGEARGLVGAIEARWRAQGDPDLAAMAPRLAAIADALAADGAEQDGSVDVFCYTLF